MKKNPEQEYEIKFLGWFSKYWKLSDMHKWFINCLNVKINRNDNRNGRCYSDEWQRNIIKDARIINENKRRIINRGMNLLCTPEMKQKYPEINNNIWEDQ